MSNITQVTIGNADYNAIVEDQRNIVEIVHEEPNTVVIRLPGVEVAQEPSVLYGSGVPWIQIEV